MRNQSFDIVGLDSKELISLGIGLDTWELMDFRGPVFSASRVGGPQGRTHLLLPSDLLRLLYERFAGANPSGCPKVRTEQIEDYLFRRGDSEELRDRLWEQGDVGWDVFDSRLPPNGRDPIKRYLPELFERGVLDSILKDPRLDLDQRAPGAPPNSDEWSLDLSKHFRWSAWWNDR